MGTLGRLAAVALAAAVWSAAAALFVDSSGALAPGDRSRTVAALPDATDPCALKEPLPTGNDARCTFELARAGARPLVVDLDQRWSGNVLTQWLNVREADAVDTVHFAFARTAGVPQPARVNRLLRLRSPEGDEHLVYVVGRCGGTVCQSSDLVIVGPRGAQLRTLLTFRLGPLADVQVRERAVVAIDASFLEGAQRPDAIVARSFVWDGSSYAMREVAKLPPPSPTPTPTPR